MSISRIVIIGAGQAGANAAIELRRRGYEGAITLIGDEAHPPYERPPLSKDALVNPAGAKLFLYPEDHYAQQNIDLRLGVRATAIDTAAHRVTLSDGETLPYGKLLLTTGAQARRLAQLDDLGDRVHRLRTLEDAEHIRAQLRPGSRALLVGAGVIGLELASSLTDLGLETVVIDPAPRAMLRNSPEILSRFLQKTHEARGVVFHFGTGVEAARREGDHLFVTLGDGTELEGDVLIYGIGVAPDDALAKTAGLHTVRGAIVVNERCVTSDPDIYAAGDAVLQVHTEGHHQRIETWENANLQSTAAICDMLGQEAPESGVSWFWTDQCGLNVQFAGEMSAPRWILRGALEEPPFLLFGLNDEGAVIAAITVNQGRDMRPAKSLIAKGAKIDPAVLTDPATKVRDLAKEI
ncbi:MAG: pyridine nucleotide-disulfide oxidoreductase [Sphingomonadales bacterium]|nr:MAG: pyridine nucleotide-disulfide oxidoreductase [Sphingomonadales bacterium]TNF06202.1 MAG: pyridine nucleotide-disulfide oxidoreductase [Sphingomonadales bacterium]